MWGNGVMRHRRYTLIMNVTASNHSLESISITFSSLRSIIDSKASAGVYSRSFPHEQQKSNFLFQEWTGFKCIKLWPRLYLSCQKLKINYNFFLVKCRVCAWRSVRYVERQHLQLIAFSFNTWSFTVCFSILSHWNFIWMNKSYFKDKQLIQKDSGTQKDLNYSCLNRR